MAPRRPVKLHSIGCLYSCHTSTVAFDLELVSVTLVLVCSRIQVMPDRQSARTVEVSENRRLPFFKHRFPGVLTTNFRGYVILKKSISYLGLIMQY
jgi:hypothetical protein